LRDWVGERIKQSISHEYDLKLQLHKAEIDRQNAEHHARFSRQYEKGADTLAGTFSRLMVLYRAVGDYVSLAGTADTLDARFQRATGALLDLDGYYFSQETYVPESLAKQTREVIRTINRILADWAIKVHGQPRDAESRTAWINSVTQIRDTIPPLLDNLAAEYRRQIGVRD
jgi:hypothetical protein